MVKKRKRNHREILKAFEEEVLNRNLGISEHGDAAFYFVHTVLKAYAVKEQQEADAKKNASVDCEKAPTSDENSAKVESTVSEGEA